MKEIKPTNQRIIRNRLDYNDIKIDTKLIFKCNYIYLDSLK